MKQFTRRTWPVVTCWEEKNFTLHTHKTKEMMWGLEELIHLGLSVDWRWRGSVALNYQRHDHITRELTVKWKSPCWAGGPFCGWGLGLGGLSSSCTSWETWGKFNMPPKIPTNVHSCFVDSIIRPPAGSDKDLWDTSSLSARPVCPHNPQQSLLHCKDLSSPLTWTVHKLTLGIYERQEIHLEKQLFFQQWLAW